MQQITQSVRNGQLRVVRCPEPLVKAQHLLICNTHSIISAGTEKSVVDLAGKSLWAKARARPDQVRRVIQKVRDEGLFKTLAQVTAKLDEPVQMGYSSSGIVLACGAGVQGIRPGDRVASNGPHAGIVCVPKNLCALVPENVPSDHAAFTVVSSIALQGVRLARLGLGDTVLVVGLGLIGQIAVQLLKAQGCTVLGTDLDAKKCQLAVQQGADAARPDLTADEVLQRTRGLGADAVLITAATKSDGPITLAGEAVRAKGRVVVVGAVGMNLTRQPFYLKEAELVVSCSYGPGRYDPAYEQGGHDYPPGHVRWTEQRNFQAVLDLMARGKLNVAPLITHRFPIETAEQAYQLIQTGSEPYLGIVLEYPGPTVGPAEHRIERQATPVHDKLGVGWLGSGNFARMVLLPLVRKFPALHPRVLCSGSGVQALASVNSFGFEAAATNEEEVFSDDRVQAVFVVTRHGAHARQVVKALHAGKNVFTEKPLALTLQELDEIQAALLDAPNPGPLLMVGFNRRFSPAARTVQDFFSAVQAPLTVSIRFNAGALPASHWAQDELVGGGRIIGEACHAIDLATYLTGSLPVRVYAESVGGVHAPQITEDQCFITLRHANGSVSSIAYLAGGDRTFPKERVEVMGGGRVAVIDDFREVSLTAAGKTRQVKTWSQDKGHHAEVEAFVNAICAGQEAPITWSELYAVSAASILAVASIREGMPLEVA